MQDQLIVVENQSTVVTAEQLDKIVAALDLQAVRDYNHCRWVTGGFATGGHVQALIAGTKPPVGSWNLIIMDKSDQQGALGYHDDEQGNGIPYAEVFAQDSLDDGATVSAVASHEMLEMLVDPDVQNVKTATRHDTNQLYIIEVADPVQGNDYDLNHPGLEGVLVADYCLPCWWDLEAFHGHWSHRHAVGGPWQIAPQGYISIAPVEDPNNWSQIFGEEKTALPKWASRLPRIHGRPA